MTRALILALFLSGCAAAPSCYVGVGIFPPGPFIHCGIDATPEEDPDA